MTHSFRNSAYERNDKERYFTEPWATRALTPFIPDYVSARPLWEPAAGRGDLVRVLSDFGYDVVASDIDLSEYDYDLGSVREEDFLKTEPTMEIAEEYSGIVTNPPYGKEEPDEFGKRAKMPLAEQFVRKALEHGVDFVAMLLRSEFNTAVSRTDLFDRTIHPFAFEVVLTTRPRWDWWLPEPPPPPPGEKKKNKSPMHCYSWFVWDRKWAGPHTTYWCGKDGPSHKMEIDI